VDKEGRKRLFYGVGLVLVLLCLAKAGGMYISGRHGHALDDTDWMIVFVLGMLAAFFVGYGKRRR